MRLTERSELVPMTITPLLFEAFLKCPTKCWLRSKGERSPGGTYADWVQAHNESYRADAVRRLTANLSVAKSAVAPPVETLKLAQWRFATDVTAASATNAEPKHSGESRLHAVERTPSYGRGKPALFVPIRFIFRNKLTKDDKLVLAFDALVLSQVLGREVSLGKIIHGDDHAALKVKTSALAGEVRKQVGKITALLANDTAPDLALNRHCAECEFRDRCRKIAIEKDDLSLLAGMSAKERQKLRSKGIFTVTQLSYTFRPRRRPKRLRDKREKYHHSLKALAIREKTIHIVGSPELKIEGTPVYLDVEGLPDRDFYYLIGLRIGDGDSAVQHSLWADTVEDEGKIWREFLAILETVEKPVLIHYGSYETTFFKRMSQRYGIPDESSGAGESIASAMNLLSFMFGRIYFPTHTNKLKDIAPLLGARWNPPAVSGIQTISWRLDWEQTHGSAIHDILLAYNQDDCTALNLLIAETLDVLANSELRADVDRADAPKNAASPRSAEIHRTFTAVLKSAYSDYSKSRITLATAGSSEQRPRSEKSRPKPSPKPKLPRIKGRIIRVPRKRKCDSHPDQPTALVPMKRPAERSFVDLAFTGTGCKKSVIRYIGKRARCPHCDARYVPPAFKDVHYMVYGPGFFVWVVYLRIALRLSCRLITQASHDLFGVELHPQSIERFVGRCSESHSKTERHLLEKMLDSAAIHVDETKLSILGNQQFVWVLTDGRHVMFRLTEGRETGFLEPLLANYKGTLVSDFYGGYDALPCRQQKCLVHLIRDLNDDLWKNPFNIELEAFVASVRDLLLPILADAQRFGLKTFHLRKHRQRVDAFYRNSIDDSPVGQELILKYQKRFARYRESMFTFLEGDGIPWNNNAAERALRHVAVQRKISGAFSSEGAQDYIRLLGVAQSCRFQEKSFLGFLRSGLLDVDAYKEPRSRRTHRLPGSAAPARTGELATELPSCASAKPANTWAWTFWISSVQGRRTSTPSRKAGSSAGGGNSPASRRNCL